MRITFLRAPSARAGAVAILLVLVGVAARARPAVPDEAQPGVSVAAGADTAAGDGMRASEDASLRLVPWHLPSADRWQHASLAFSIGLGTGVVSEEPAVAAGVALGLGLFKELLDRRGGRADPGDLLWGAAGAALAVLATAALSR